MREASFDEAISRLSPQLWEKHLSFRERHTEKWDQHDESIKKRQTHISRLLAGIHKTVVEIRDCREKLESQNAGEALEAYLKS